MDMKLKQNLLLPNLIPLILFIYEPNTIKTTHTQPNTTQITAPQPPKIHTPLKRSSRPTRTPTWLNDFVISHTQTINQAVEATPTATTGVSEHFANMVARIVESEEPSSYYEVVTQPDWVYVMRKELQVLEENNTWEITSPPPGRKAIGCRWVYKTKY